MEKFYKKNEIGVNIPYEVIGYYNTENEEYCLYTDYTKDTTNHMGIKLYVSKKIDNKYEDLSSEESKNIISKLNNEILNDLRSD